jgi:hypothetical protein
MGTICKLSNSNLFSPGTAQNSITEKTFRKCKVKLYMYLVDPANGSHNPVSLGFTVNGRTFVRCHYSCNAKFEIHHMNTFSSSWHLMEGALEWIWPSWSDWILVRGRGAFLGASSNRGTNIPLSLKMAQKGHFPPERGGWGCAPMDPPMYEAPCGN